MARLYEKLTSSLTCLFRGLRGWASWRETILLLSFILFRYSGEANRSVEKLTVEKQPVLTFPIGGVHLDTQFFSGKYVSQEAEGARGKTLAKALLVVSGEETRQERA